MDIPSHSTNKAPKAPLLRVEVSFKRRAEHVTTHRRQREGVKARDLLTKYPKEKAESLLKSLRSRGLWAYDTDFPKDEEDHMDGWAGLVCSAS